MLAIQRLQPGVHVAMGAAPLRAIELPRNLIPGQRENGYLAAKREFAKMDPLQQRFFLAFLGIRNKLSPNVLTWESQIFDQAIASHGVPRDPKGPPPDTLRLVAEALKRMDIKIPAVARPLLAISRSGKPAFNRLPIAEQQLLLATIRLIQTGALRPTSHDRNRTRIVHTAKKRYALQSLPVNLKKPLLFVRTLCRAAETVNLDLSVLQEKSVKRSARRASA